MNEQWKNLVIEMEIDYKAHDAFFERLIDPFESVSSSQINEVLRSVRITIPEGDMTAEEAWNKITDIAADCALDGLDLIVARCYTERCWSREP